MRPTFKTSGFTVVELVIAMTIAAIMMTGLIALIINLANVGAGTIEVSKQVNETQTAQSMIRDDLKLTSKFLLTTTIADIKRGGGTWDFRGAGNGKRVLILRTLATTKYKTDTSRQPVYKQAGGCPIGNQPAYNNIVYFVDNMTLYRRVLIDPPVTNTYCAGQAIQQIRTCTDPSANGAPSNCKERDVVVAQNVSMFDILYYANAGDVSPISTIFDPSSVQTNLDPLTTIKVTLQTSKLIGGQINEYATQLRGTRIDGN